MTGRPDNDPLLTFLDGGPLPEGGAELARQLATDPALADRLARHARLEAALLALGAQSFRMAEAWEQAGTVASAHEALFESEDAAPAPRPHRPGRRWPALAAAAALLAGIGVAGFMTRPAATPASGEDKGRSTVTAARPPAPLVATGDAARKRAPAPAVAGPLDATPIPPEDRPPVPPPAESEPPDAGPPTAPVASPASPAPAGPKEVAPETLRPADPPPPPPAGRTFAKSPEPTPAPPARADAAGPAPPAPPPPPAAPAATRLAAVKGVVFVLRPDGTQARAAAGLDLADGLGLRTGADGAATIRFADNTRIELAAATTVSSLSQTPPPDDPAFESGPAKRVSLTEGTITASVAKQPAGREMALDTPDARLHVLGTRFTLAASPKATTLKVWQGAVRVTRIADGRATVVKGGYSLSLPREAPPPADSGPPPDGAYEPGNERRRTDRGGTSE